MIELPDLGVVLRRASQDVSAAFGFSLAVGELSVPPCVGASAWARVRI